MAENTTGPIETEIADLERRLQEKRAELGADASTPYERAEVHEAVGERIQQSVPNYQPAPAASQPVAGTPSWQDPALAGPVQQLVNVVFTQSLQAAIDQAVASGNPALIDALHDVLADEFHSQLLERRKVEPAP
ncbi:MAG TPA: hypothetical protein VMU12_00660 [Candidatus Paceibacterota bacterium]|nr:hypothetical protein [Candidatus Paceibacterota bacterium]